MGQHGAEKDPLISVGLDKGTRSMQLMTNHLHTGMDQSLALQTHHTLTEFTCSPSSAEITTHRYHPLSSLSAKSTYLVSMPKEMYNCGQIGHSFNV
jgi:hypothetical protein